jgi:hypothetical protein
MITPLPEVSAIVAGLEELSYTFCKVVATLLQLPVLKHTVPVASGKVMVRSAVRVMDCSVIPKLSTVPSERVILPWSALVTPIWPRVRCPPVLSKAAVIEPPPPPKSPAGGSHLDADELGFGYADVKRGILWQLVNTNPVIGSIDV